MSGKAKAPIPEPVVQLQRQLDQFRSTQQPRRTKLPGLPWQAAVELARQYGVYCVVTNKATRLRPITPQPGQPTVTS